MEWLIYAVIGVVAGFFAGLLGIGGGAVISPLLIVVFVSLIGLAPGVSTYMAIGTALTVTALTSPVGAVVHYKNGNVLAPLAAPASAGVVAGALAGVPLALALPAALLKTALAAFLLITGYAMLFGKKRGGGKESMHLPKAPLSGVAAIIGAVSAAIGIGGGAMLVPYLHRRGVPIKKAIGTSALVVFPMSWCAAAGYMLQMPAAAANAPEGALGYVYLPAVAGITVFSVIAAALGGRATARLPNRALRRAFGVLLLLISLRLLWLSLFSHNA